MKKDFRLYMRLSEDELKKAKEAADKKKITVSEMIRRYIAKLK